MSAGTARARSKQRTSRLASSILIGIGLLLLLLSAGTVAYAQWVDAVHAANRPVGPAESLPARLASSAQLTVEIGGPATAESPVPAGGASPTALAVAAPPPTPAPPRTAKPTATPRPRDYGPTTWMKIPSIGVDSRIMEVGVQNGEYVVPSWEVGHHEDSPAAGQPGNSIFNGHVETINAGRIFAHLKDVQVGDAIYTYSATDRLAWRVDSVETVPYTDQRFIQPTTTTQITLYTCTGRFLPLEREYDHRLVVTAHLLKASRE
jgi:LPXTG-site transpeptidase (sortase) family protein